QWLSGAKPSGASTLSGHGGSFDWARAKPPPEPRTAAKTKDNLKEFFLLPSASFMCLTLYFSTFSIHRCCSVVRRIETGVPPDGRHQKLTRPRINCKTII